MKMKSDIVSGRRGDRADKLYAEFVRVRTQDEAVKVLAGKDALVLVERGKPRSLKLRCPCGADHILTVNLDRALGLAWRLNITGSSVSLYPSVWLETGCRCHFILRRNRVYIYGRSVRSKKRDGSDLYSRGR